MGALLKKETLDAKLGSGVKFRVSVAQMLPLPSTQQDAKPELFNFKFANFRDERGAGIRHPTTNMLNMRC